MQEFGGHALATMKLHVSVFHLLDQIESQGPGGLFLELWVEHAVWWLKHKLQHHIREEPEKVFMNDQTLIMAATHRRIEHPSICLEDHERSSGRRKTFPSYDPDDVSAHLVGKRVSGGLQDRELQTVLTQLSRQLGGSGAHYSCLGWPVAEEGCYRALHAAGELHLDMFTQAEISDGCVLSSEQTTGQPETENGWSYIAFSTDDDSSPLRCIGTPVCFVRAYADSSGLPQFSDRVPAVSGPEYVDVPVPHNGDEALTCKPVRLVVLKLWHADVCSSGTVGCMVADDPVTKELPDLMVVRNLSTSKTLRDTSRPTSTACVYYGEYLVDLCELQAQLVPTAVQKEGKGRDVMYFMTARKASF